MKFTGLFFSSFPRNMPFETAALPDGREAVRSAGLASEGLPLVTSVAQRMWVCAHRLFYHGTTLCTGSVDPRARVRLQTWEERWGVVRPLAWLSLGLAVFSSRGTTRYVL